MAGHTTREAPQRALAGLVNLSDTPTPDSPHDGTTEGRVTANGCPSHRYTPIGGKGDACDGRSPGSRVFVLGASGLPSFPVAVVDAGTRRLQLRGQPGPWHSPCRTPFPLASPSPGNRRHTNASAFGKAAKGPQERTAGPKVSDKSDQLHSDPTLTELSPVR